MLNKHLTTNDILQCDGSPIDNNLMPEYVGQLCIDITNELIYIAKTLDESGWITVASSAEGNGGNNNELHETIVALSNILGNTELQTKEKTVTAAINELFQSANNGKELIANAIGEPLSKDKTFSAMSTDINGLLSTFKTNMMNNGVTIESNDKFKSLIDKVDEKLTKDNNTINSLNTDKTNLTNQVNSLNSNIENTRSTLARLMQEGGYDITGSESINNLLNLLVSSGISVRDIKQIDGGHEHTFILKHDGSLYSCGAYGYGGLGLGDSTNRYTFTQVTKNINKDVKQIACGDYHTFILKKDGSIWSCGNNNKGQLGLGSSDTNTHDTFTKVTTNINNDVKQIVCGYQYTFILKNDGSIWACGYNDKGQLGLGNTTSKKSFTKVTTNINNDVKQVVCGYNHTYILKNDGTVWSCGYNKDGQLGLGTSDTNAHSTFTKVTTNISNVKQIACGGYYTCILKNDGSLWVCGANDEGQLGLNDTTDRTTFTKVTTNVKQVACGYYHTFILKNDGSLWGCGNNERDQLGLNSTSSYISSFTKVTENINNDVIQIACGYYHTFILKKNSSTWSCGYNIHGQIGLGDTTDRYIFTIIPRGI